MAKITIRRGDTTNIALAITTSGGSAIDLTGATVYFTVRDVFPTTQVDDTDAQIVKDVTSHTSPTEGETTIALTDTQTNIAAGKYKYDVQVKDASANITTYDVGDFEVLNHVTVRTT